MRERGFFWSPLGSKQLSMKGSSVEFEVKEREGRRGGRGGKGCLRSNHSSMNNSPGGVSIVERLLCCGMVALINS